MSTAIVPKILMNISLGAYARMSPNMNAAMPRKQPNTAVELIIDHQRHINWTERERAAYRTSRNTPLKTAYVCAKAGLAWNKGLDWMLGVVMGMLGGNVIWQCESVYLALTC
jgi:hypothetical protein